MREYTFDTLSVGTSESFSVEITDNLLDGFRDITGDVNPLHASDEFARRRGYKSRVVFGMLTTSLYSTLAGVWLPGKYCLLHEISTKFKKPVFVGDTLTVKGTVTDVSAALGRVEIKAVTTNQNGEVVNRATIKAGITAEDR